jgi:hypothetical protein
MVESEHRLVTRGLGLRRLHAVVGISAGGMQVFQWANRAPGVLREGRGGGRLPALHPRGARVLGEAGERRP